MKAAKVKPAPKRRQGTASHARRKPGRRRPDPRVVLMTGPLTLAPERVLTLDKAQTIAGIIRQEKLAFRLPTIAFIARNGEAVPVLRKDWTTRKVRRGEVLTFISVPRGGGGGNNNSKQIIGLIASIALALAAPFAGAAIAGALGFTSALAVNVASTAFLLGGSLLLGLLFNQPQGPQEGEQVYTVSAGSNRATPLEPVPVLYGELKYPPPLAARPYSEFEGNEQFLYQLHCLTCGEARVDRWHIGETLAWTSADGFTNSFSGIEIEVIDPGDDITLFPANVVVSDNVSGQTVPDPPDILGGFAINQAGTEIESIAWDFVFAQGLYTGGGSGGSVSNASRQLVGEYRKIDDDGDPIGSWTTGFSEIITRKTRTPQRFTRKVAVPSGRYEARLKALDEDTTDAGQKINRVNWVGLRGYLTDWTVPSGVTLVATKIRANDQLSQVSSSQYFFTVQRLLPTYNPDTQTWSSETATSGIAWAAADLIRNTDYGLGLSESLYDLDWLAAYNLVWAGRGDEFNGLFDRKWIAQDALNAILRVGRAGTVRIGGKIGFVRDEPKQIKRATFTSRNIVKGTFSRRFLLFDDEAPDHIVAKYIDRTSWRDREVNAIISAVGSAEPIEREYFGITNRAHCWREAIRDAAENAYRREFVTFQTENEGKLLVRGDPILVQGPLLRNVFVAALDDRDGDDLTLDREFEPEDGVEYHVIIRDKFGKEWGPVEVDAFTGPDTINLDPVDRLSAEASMGILSDILPDDRREKAHVLICREESRPFDGLVVSCIPDGPDRFTVLAVKDDQRVHLADETEIIPAPYTPPSLYAPVPEAPTIVGLSAIARNGTLHIELEAGWQSAAGAQRYVAEISYDDNAQASPGTASWTPVHDSVGNRFTAVILPQNWTLRVAAVGARQGPWSYFSGTSPAPALAPGTVTPESLDALLTAFIESVKSGLPADLFHARADLEQLSTAVNEHFAKIIEGVGRLNLAVGSRFGEAKAAAELALLAATTLNSALAGLFVDIFATTGNGQAEGLLRFIAVSAPEGVATTFAVECRATIEDEFAFAGLYLDAGVVAQGGTSRIRMVADSIWLATPDSSQIYNALLASYQGDPLDTPIVTGEVRADLSGRLTVHSTDVTTAAEVKFPIGARPGFRYAHVFRQIGGSNTITFDDDVFLDPHPVVNQTDGVISVVENLILGINPPEVIATLIAEATRSPVAQLRDTGFSATFSTGASAGPATLANLDFVPGTAIFVCALAIRDSTAVPAQSQVVGDAALTDWNHVASDVFQLASGVYQCRIRAAWKIADGSETSVQLFTYSGSGAHRNMMLAQTFSIDFLGGALSVFDPAADVQPNNSSLSNQIINLSGQSVPNFGVSFGAAFSSVDVNQTFSETPDSDTGATVGGLPIPANGQLKIKRYTSAPADITTGLAALSGADTTDPRGLISFGIKVE